MKQDKQVQGFAEFCIWYLQEDQGLTVKQISKKTKLCTTTIYRMRRGRCSTQTHIGTIQKLAAATGLRVSLRDYTEEDIYVTRSLPNISDASL